MGAKGWIIFSAIAVAILGGLVYISGKNNKTLDVSSYNIDQIIGANDQDGQIGDHVFGNKDSKVVLIEYGDFQCPGCGTIHVRVKELTEKYQDKIAFVFRNLPLSSMHPNARAAAASAEAASLQGKYWEMHNMVYEHQDEWSSASAKDRGNIFERYASTLGLDVEKFKTDIASEAVTKKINFDQAVFRRTGLPQSTPTFTLNGKTLEQDIWTDSTTFEEALVKAGITLEKIQTAAEQ